MRTACVTANASSGRQGGASRGTTSTQHEGDDDADSRQARKIAQEKSAAGWLIAADALEEQGDDAEAARCRIVGEVIGNIVPMLSNRKSGDGIRRFEFEAEGERFEISIMGFYSCRICIRTWTATAA